MKKIVILLFLAVSVFFLVSCNNKNGNNDALRDTRPGPDLSAASAPKTDPNSVPAGGTGGTSPRPRQIEETTSLVRADDSSPPESSTSEPAAGEADARVSPSPSVGVGDQTLSYAPQSDGADDPPPRSPVASEVQPDGDVKQGGTGGTSPSLQPSKDLFDFSTPEGLFKFYQHLKDLGREELEIEAFEVLTGSDEDKEYLDKHIGEVVRLEGDHYVYRVEGKNYEGGGMRTSKSCGIWAVRRLLRHAHALGLWGILEDAWWKMSDREIRKFLATVNGFEGYSMCADEDREDIAGNGMLSNEAVVNLQRFFGVPPKSCMVRVPHLNNMCFIALDAAIDNHGYAMGDTPLLEVVRVGQNLYPIPVR